jgi:hypothetical protein
MSNANILRKFIRQSLLLEEVQPAGGQNLVDAITRECIKWAIDKNRPAKKELSVSFKIKNMVFVNRGTLGGVVPFFNFNCKLKNDLKGDDSTFDEQTHRYSEEAVDAAMNEKFTLNLEITTRPRHQVAQINGVVASTVTTLSIDPFQTGRGAKEFNPDSLKSTIRHELIHVSQLVNNIVIQYDRALRVSTPDDLEPIYVAEDVSSPDKKLGRGAFGIGKNPTGKRQWVEATEERLRQLEDELEKNPQDRKKKKEYNDLLRARDENYFLDDFEYPTWKSDLLDDIITYATKKQKLSGWDLRGIASEHLAGSTKIGVNSVAVDMAKELRDNPMKFARKYSNRSKYYLFHVLDQRPEFIKDFILGLEKRLKDWIEV